MEAGEVILIDTATRPGAVGIVLENEVDNLSGGSKLSNGKTLFSRTLSKGSEFLIYELQQLGVVAALQRAPKVVVAVGPGSFTGLRVGVAAACGLLVGGRGEYLPVPTLAAGLVGVINRDLLSGGLLRAGGASLEGSSPSGDERAIAFVAGAGGYFISRFSFSLNERKVSKLKQLEASCYLSQQEFEETNSRDGVLLIAENELAEVLIPGLALISEIPSCSFLDDVGSINSPKVVYARESKHLTLEDRGVKVLSAS